MFFSVLEVRTPVKILQTINILVRNKKEYSLLGTIKKLKWGIFIAPIHLKAIEELRFVVVNLSRDYAVQGSA